METFDSGGGDRRDLRAEHGGHEEDVDAMKLITDTEIQARDNEALTSDLASGWFGECCS